MPRSPRSTRGCISSDDHSDRRPGQSRSHHAIEKLATKLGLISERETRIDWLLRCACGFDDLVIAQHLLEVGANRSAREAESREMPLHGAADDGHEALALPLVRRGADVSAADLGGWTQLQFAAEDGKEAVARLLVDRGSDVSAADHSGLTRCTLRR